MKRLLPGSLAGQAILVLVVGLMVSHLLSMVFYSGERVDALTVLGARNMAQRTANIAHLVADVPPEWRARIADALDEPDFRVRLSPDSMLVTEAANDWRADLVRRFIAEQLHADTPRAVRVQVLDLSDEGQWSGSAEGLGDMPQTWQHMGRMLHGAPFAQSLRVSVELPDGQWINFAALLPKSESLWSGAALVSMAFMTLGVLVASVWAVRRLTSPLRGLAAAAERLGRDVDATPLADDGPHEVRRAAHAFNRMQDRLRRLIDARTHMLAAVSHDLRTPLTTLRLRIELLEDGEDRARMLATLDEMEAMIASMLAFTCEQTKVEERRTVDLAALLETMVEDMNEAGATIRFTGPDRLSYSCSPLALKRALSNLLTNAVKYADAVTVSLGTDPTHVHVTVDDDGPGIPSGMLERVFQPFFRVEESRSRDTGGVGLGLAVARTIVHAHGGEIHLENRVQGGLRARVVLPA